MAGWDQGDLEIAEDETMRAGSSHLSLGSGGPRPPRPPGIRGGGGDGSLAIRSGEGRGPHSREAVEDESNNEPEEDEEIEEEEEDDDDRPVAPRPVPVVAVVPVDGSSEQERRTKRTVARVLQANVKTRHLRWTTKPIGKKPKFSKYGGAEADLIPTLAHNDEKSRKRTRDGERSLSLEELREERKECWFCAEADYEQMAVADSDLNAMLGIVFENMHLIDMEEIAEAVSEYHFKYIWTPLEMQGKRCMKLPADKVFKHFIRPHTLDPRFAVIKLVRENWQMQKKAKKHMVKVNAETGEEVLNSDMVKTKLLLENALYKLYKWDAPNMNCYVSAWKALDGSTLSLYSKRKHVYKTT